MVQYALLFIYMVLRAFVSHLMFRVGEVYARHQNGLPSSEEDGDSDITDTVGHIARIGSLALVVFSCVTLASSVLLPPLVKPPDSGHKPPNESTIEGHSSLLARLWRTSCRIPDALTALIDRTYPYR